MLWDQGTWTPQVPDVGAALKKGDLKFTLDGFKLRGSWVLVRTGGRYGSGDARSWLLIKHKDEWAGELDIAAFAPRSVKGEGDFEDILAADNPDVWVSNRPVEGGETGAMLKEIIERAAALKAASGSKTDVRPAKPRTGRRGGAPRAVRHAGAKPKPPGRTAASPKATTRKTKKR
jgi:bifunctional non-homologous end joining protein LigD